jgi:outer membrane protein assembly factor BamB
MPPAEPGSPFATAAEEIVHRCGVTDGYCLDLACGDGRLALELARRTGLQIYAVDIDPEKVLAARRMLDAAGLYGVRVTVHQGDPAAMPYSNWFADLIVSGRSLTEGPDLLPEDVIHRFQRPCGGTVCVGKPGAMRQSVRGPLDGAGSWTHQYAGAGNKLCSDDTRLRSPLAMLWFRDSDLLMPNRHGRGPAPLVYQGRMLVEGVDGLRAVNAYNGETLWDVRLPGVLKPYHQEHLMGTAGTGSNYCVGDGHLFVQIGDRCLVLNLVDGTTEAELQPPPRSDDKPGVWGYIAYENRTLFGTLVDDEHLVKYRYGRSDMRRQFTESEVLFALDAKTGDLQWRYEAEHSIRHNAIAVGAGRVYLIDRPLAPVDDAGFDRDAVLAEAKRRAASDGSDPNEVFRRLTDHPTGRLLALEAATGEVLWRTDEDVFGTMLALSPEHDVLLMSYQPTRFRLDSELGGRMAAVRASDGKQLWDVEADYASRPILNGQAVYAQPGAWDLLTGERLPLEFSRSYGCGIIAGSARLLVFRSATLGYFDLDGTRQTENYGGIRPGCWVNAIPAGGLVLLGDAASWCTCSYLNQATIALKPAEGGGPSPGTDR